MWSMYIILFIYVIYIILFTFLISIILFTFGNDGETDSDVQCLQ